MKLNNQTAKTLKKDFPIFKNNPGLVYLDSAATSQKPNQVIKTMSEFYEKDNANVGRGIYILAARATEKYEDARKNVAEFINAEKNEIVFTKNTTESINLLSYVISSIIPKEKNEILLTEMEHHSNLVPWQQLAKRKGFSLKFVKIKPDFTLDMDDVKKKLTNKTAVFSFTYVSNVLGTVNDVRLLTKLAKSKDALVVIDAAQAIQHMSVNVKDIGCDFLAFSSHKMLGPAGVGVLYGRKDLLEKMPPFNFGGGMIEKVSFDDSSWRNIPERFEAGTQNVAGVVGLVEAIKYIKKIGIENIRDWDKKLMAYAINKLKEIDGIKLYNPGLDKSTSIISFNIQRIHPHDVAEMLNKDGIAIRAGHHCAMPLMKTLKVVGTCRVSFYIYNTFENVDKLVVTLNKINKKFNG